MSQYLMEKDEPVTKTKRRVAPNALLQKGEMGGTLTLAVVLARKYAGTKSRWFEEPRDSEGFHISEKAKKEPDKETFRDLARNLKRIYGYDIISAVRKDN